MPASANENLIKLQATVDIVEVWRTFDKTIPWLIAVQLITNNSLCALITYFHI